MDETLKDLEALRETLRFKKRAFAGHSTGGMLGYIYAGRFDVQCPIKFGEEIADLIPHSKLTVFERSNHNPFSEEEGKFIQFVKDTIR